MFVRVSELAKQIKEKGQRSTAELPGLLRQAEELALDLSQDALIRALAHRAAGNARQLLNQYQSALDSYNAAAVLLEDLNQPIELGRTLHAKVGMLFSLSRFDELFECSKRARKIFEESADHNRLARLDVNLATAYHRLGRHKEALECSERAVSVLNDGDDSEGLVAASINSAVTLTAMHEFERAEQRYGTALETAKRSGMSSWVLLSRYNLAYLRYLQGDTAAALVELQAIRREYERLNDEFMLCQSWLDESEILLEIGDLDECVRCAGVARVLGQRLGLNSEIAKSLLFEAAADFRLGQNDRAIDLLSQATRRFASEGDNVSAAVSMLQTALFRGEHGDASGLAEAAKARLQLQDSGLPHRLALADIVIGRIRRAHGDLDGAMDSFKSALALSERSRSDWMQFHAAYELGVSLDFQNDPDGIRLFERAEAMLDSLWDRLGSDDLKMMFLADRENVYTHLVKSSVQNSPHTAFDFSEKARSRVLRERLLNEDRGKLPSAISGSLSDDETLIEYFISGDDLFIFAVKSEGLVCLQRPGAIPRLLADWNELDRHLASCGVKWERLQRVQHHLLSTAQTHLKNLHRELIEPVQSEIRGNIVFAPHGFLHAIPLHALYDGEKYVAERAAVSYTPGATLYCTPAPSRQFDGPLFVAFSTTSDVSSIEEVEESSAHWTGASILVNPSIDELRRAFTKPRVLVHIAGHAGVDAVSGKLSWIETPEGRLTSRNLMDMQIQANTVVLTGCQTARRFIHPGDEWVGLMRSVYLSGAATVVSALWDIRDEAARRFAGEFYRIFKGDNARAAVQRASAAVREWRSHPYFWGGFEVFVRKVRRGGTGQEKLCK